MSKNLSVFLLAIAVITLIVLGLIIGNPAEALSVFQTIQGGTGTSTPSGILYGDNGATGHLNTVSIGSNLTFAGGTLSAAGGGGASTDKWATSTDNTSIYPNSATAVAIGLTNPGSTLELKATSTAATGNTFIAWDSTGRNMFDIQNTGNVGIASSSPFQALSVVGNGWINGNSFHVGTIPNTIMGGPCTNLAQTCSELIGNDNTTAGVSYIIQNTNPGTSAYSDIFFANDNPGAVANYTALAFNSHAHTDTIFGSAFALLDQFSINNTIGQVTLGASAVTGNINFIVGGSATTNEIARFVPGALLIGTTTPAFNSVLNVSGATSAIFGGKLVRISDTAAIGSGVPDFAVGGAATSTDVFSVIETASGNYTNGLSITGTTAGGGVTEQVVSTANNENLSILPKSGGSWTIGNTVSGSSFLNVGTGGNVNFRTNGTTIASIGNTATFSTANAAGATGRFVINGTTQAGPITASAPYQNVVINDGFNVTHASGAITAAQNEMGITPHTDLFPVGTTVANSTISSSTVLFIAGPSAPGAQANITNAYGIFIGPGVGTFTSASTTFAAAFSAVAPTGAATNVVSTTTGRVFMNSLTTSASTQSVIICGAGATGGELIAESISCTASAARYKDDIQTLTGSLAELMQLRPVSFKWKADFNKGFETDPNKTGTQYSLIADEVQKVDPNLTIVTTATTSFEGVTYAPGTVQGIQDSNHWAAFLVEAIQEQQKEIISLEKGVTIVTQSAQDNWQDVLIGLLLLGFLWQQVQLNKLKK